MSNNPSAEGAEPAVRDMDAWAEAARQMAQRADTDTEPPAAPAGEDGGHVADGGSWQGPGAWWQSTRGGPSASRVWDTPGAGGEARDGEWGSCVGWRSHGSSWRDCPQSQEWGSGYRWRPDPGGTASRREQTTESDKGWLRIGSA